MIELFFILWCMLCVLKDILKCIDGKLNPVSLVEI